MRIFNFANSLIWFIKQCHQLQLGFLKLLKGSKIRNESKHGYQFASFAPYEVISNNYITVDELITLKKMEDVLDRYYNSGRFSKTLEYLVKEPFSFYKSLCEFLSFNSPPSVNALYRALFDYASNRQDALLIKAILKLDYLSSHGLADCHLFCAQAAARL